MVPRMCIANALTLYAELALAAEELVAGVEARTAALAADFGERKARLAAVLTAARTKYLARCALLAAERGRRRGS